ncbi:MAG: Clp protease ClpP [Bacteroides sp.]|nr:Clp protease ClpP [Bacteroides sp.]
MDHTNTKPYKHIVGEVATGKVASIRFFGKITAETTGQFNEEFDYLESVVRPSLIRVLINSEGGSVLHGMSTYSTIQNSTIPTECVIEGMAASMGSVLWAAGDKSYMRDYGILMIHFPRLPDQREDSAADLVGAFANQIKTIYRKRFNLSVDLVERIMTGEVGKDRTFFDCRSAVVAGIIPESHVLNTFPQLCEKVRNALLKSADVNDIQSLMEEVCMEAEALDMDQKLCIENFPILNKQMQNRKRMKETSTSPEYGAVAASLGFTDQYEVKDVMARIGELMGVEAKLTETRKELNDATVVIAGKDATIGNLESELEKIKASLSEYEEKEKAKRAQEIHDMVQGAKDAGKIEASAVAHWIVMAEVNPELVKQTLDSIPARQQITREIATDPANVQAAAESTKTLEDKLAEKVTAVVGKDFEFMSLK